MNPSPTPTSIDSLEGETSPLRLSKEEEIFLELPDSKLAIRLHERKINSDKNRSLLQIFFGLFNARMLAISAFLAALAPIAELNRKAWDFYRKRQELTAILKMARELMEIGAKDQALTELKRAEKIDPSSYEIDAISGLIQLSELAKGQADFGSVRAYERRYKELLKENPLAQYFMANAYLETNLDKAFDYLTKAQQRQDQEISPVLQVRISSARIMAIERQLNYVSEVKERDMLLEQATSLFEEAESVMQDKAGKLDFTKAKVALYNNYAYISTRLDELGRGNKNRNREVLAKLSFQAAMESGDAMLIGRTSIGVAQQHLSGSSPDYVKASAGIDFAIAHLANTTDAKGKYAAEYHRGLIAKGMGHYAEAKAAMESTLRASGVVSDYGMQIQAHSQLARLAIFLNSYHEARQHWQIMLLVMSHMNRPIDAGEKGFFELLLTLLETKQEELAKLVASQQFEKIQREAITKPQQNSLVGACTEWIEFMHELEATGKIPTKHPSAKYDKELESFVLSVLSK
jgi:tetratricopeptide (TPR) repeat protein